MARRPEYALLDSGRAAKLEQIGPHRIVRPCPQAVWPRSLPKAEWDKAQAVYVRSGGGSGRWRAADPLPEQWRLFWHDRPWIVKPTGFGHIGLFPEQADNWTWLTRQCRRLQGRFQALNLFAYTGGSTLAMARSGAAVTHVDAARGVVAWARKNAELQCVPEEQVRWIVDDAMKFCARECRRKRRYTGIVLDPPTFGRGPSGEFWKIEADLADLLNLCRKLLPPAGPAFLLLSAHTPGFTPRVLERLVTAIFADAGRVTHGEMLIREAGREHRLPAGAFVRWTRA
ncbi:MAG: hypothetical protein GXP31_09370 [Kiritimatiellaeota bacterium]|nr:hypothetical protein [Kiritimatiellota bacterium]